MIAPEGTVTNGSRMYIAFEKRVSNANGTRANLPGPADKPEQFGRARELPQHY